MKKSFLILLTLFAFANSNFAQNSVDWRLGTLFSNYNKLNLFSSNHHLSALTAAFGADFDLTVNVDKNMVQVGGAIGFNTKNKELILTNLNSFNGNFLLGRHVPINDGYSANFLVGYSCQSIQITGYLKHNQDFNSLNVNNSSGILQLQNMAHCISLKVENEFLDDNFILAVSYNYSLTNNKWKPLNGTLLNAPSDNLSNFVISLKYSIFNRKWQLRAPRAVNCSLFTVFQSRLALSTDHCQLLTALSTL